MNEQVLESARDMIAGYLKKRREALNLTQQDLADLCKFHRNTIMNLEAGKFYPNLKKFLIITHHLNCYLFLEPYEADSNYTAEMKKHWEPGKPGETITKRENDAN